MAEYGFDLGARLRSLREMHGLSQRELAKRAGVSNAIISLIEQNRTSPSVGSLKRVLDGLPISLADFFAGGAAARVVRVVRGPREHFALAIGADLPVLEDQHGGPRGHAGPARPGGP